MGAFEGSNRQLDQTKAVESNETGWLKHVIEERQEAFDAAQQRQNQTANCVEKGLLPACVLSSDSPAEIKKDSGSTDRAAPQVSRDSSGRITSVEHANGVRYEFGNYENGQPTSFKITRAGDKDYGEWKREEAGLWRAYHNGKPTAEVIVGEWQLNDKGELRHTGHQDMRPVSEEKAAHKQNDGASEEFERTAAVSSKSESGEAKLTRNADGQVTEVTRANGETTRFKYGADGRLTEVKLPGGTVLTTTDGFTWQNSETGTTSKLRIKVQNDGTYSIEQDGKKAVLLPNGNAVRMDVSYPNPDRVTSVTKANGETTSFKYAADGKLNEVTLPSGTVLTTRDGGKTWANSETGKATDLKVEVKSDGTYSLEQGGKKAVLRPDGAEVRSDVPAGAPERITSVTHPDGRTSEFKYGPDGKLNEVKMPGGTVLTSTDGGKTWTSSETGQTTQMRIDVAADGTYVIERDGKMGIVRPDGTSGPFVRSLEEPGKVKERHPAGSRSGHPYEEIVYEDGTVRQLRPGGTTVEIRKDMTVTERNDHSVAVTINGDTRIAKPFHPDKEIKNIKVDETGAVTYEYKDGTASVHLRGGGVETTDKNGDKKLWLGSEVIQETKKQPDNSVVQTSDGRVTSTEHPKAFRVFRYDDRGNLNEIVGEQGTWKRMTGPDGKEYWQNQDNPDQKWHGKMSVDKGGNLHFAPHDPGAPEWTFTRTGQTVREPRGEEAKARDERRKPISVDTSVPIPRDLFDREGTASTVKSKGK
ncbi:MAG TPA: hypothetical protein V6D08_19840 [Candidatus Obscuribacterales bacterium]